MCSKYKRGYQGVELFVDQLSTVGSSRPSQNLLERRDYRSRVYDIPRRSLQIRVLSLSTQDMSETPEIRPPLHNSSAPRDKEPVGVDKLMKWQEERMERRLRGEYESAVLHLSEVVSTFLTAIQISFNGYDHRSAIT